MRCSDIAAVEDSIAPTPILKGFDEKIEIVYNRTALVLNGLCRSKDERYEVIGLTA